MPAYATSKVPVLPALVAVELGVAAVVVGLGHGVVATVVGIAVMVVVCAVVLIPWRGRPLVFTLRDQWAYRSRSRRAAATDERPAPPGVPQVLGVLRGWLPELEVVPAQDRKGEQTALVADGSAWTAVLALESDDDVLAAGVPRLAVDDLFRLLAVDDIVLESVQVAVLTVPAPTAVAMAPDSPALGSYAMHRVPAVRRTVLSLRLDPQRCAPAIAARGGRRVGVNRALRRCVEAAAELVGGPDHAWRWLDVDAAEEALGLFGGTGPTGRGDEPVRTTERWTSLQSVEQVHQSAIVTRLPDDVGAGIDVLLDAMARAPVLAGVLSVAVRVEPPDRRVVDVVVRVSGEEERQATAGIEFLGRAVSAGGLRLRRLDGTQAAGAVATIPLGGLVAR